MKNKMARSILHLNIISRCSSLPSNYIKYCKVLKGLLLVSTVCNTLQHSISFSARYQCSAHGRSAAMSTGSTRLKRRVQVCRTHGKLMTCTYQFLLLQVPNIKCLYVQDPPSANHPCLSCLPVKLEYIETQRHFTLSVS